MVDALTCDRDAFTGTVRLILDEIRSREWKVSTVKEGSSHLFIDRGDGKVIHTYGVTPPQQSYAAGILSDNKRITSIMLTSAGIYQLPFLSVGDDTYEAEQFLALHKKIVVKPVDGAHGNGIRANITTASELRDAIVYANKYSLASRVLIQKQFEVQHMEDIRILCIEEKFIAAIHRVPARVTGDGKNTIEDLIKIENSSGRRGVAYKADYAVIDELRAREYLGGDGSKIVPNANEQVRVMDVANYGAGGELIDITDDIPEWMKNEAERAAKACEVVVAGVDFLVSQLPNKTTTQDDIKSVIIEINKSPALMIHDSPHVGINRRTVKTFIDLISRV